MRNIYDNNEEAIIGTKNDKSVVVISLEECNKTHANLKQDIKNSLNEIKNGEFIDIEEAFKLAKESYRS